MSTARNNAAEDRLLHLESLVQQLIGGQGTEKSTEASVHSTKASSKQLNVTANNDSPTTTYFGSTHWSAILQDIHALKVAAGTAVLDASEESPPLTEVVGHQNSDVIFGSSGNYSLQQIISQYLPEKIEVDRFLAAYFSAKTYIAPFIHTYHFQRQYRKFWQDVNKVNPLWLSMLFSVCYFSSRFVALPDSVRNPSTNTIRDYHSFHTAAGKCLVLGQYHRPQKFTLEALLMYAQCRNLQSLDPSREVGAILAVAVRLGYEMGYHRDPDYIGKFTVFDAEMRRRSWAVCKQMDLMISFMLGMPSNIRFEACDAKSPQNLMDSDFDESSVTLPPSRTEIEGTKLLWFAVKERLVVGFYNVYCDALSFKEKSESEILQLDNEVRGMQKTIPKILRARPLAESLADDSFLIMSRIYLDFIYLKSLCILHRKYMKKGNAFSTEVCIDAGSKVVDQFLDMNKEISPGGQLYDVRWMLNNFTMNDFLLGVMVLCLAVHTKLKSGSQITTIPVLIDSKLLDLLKQSHAVCLEKSSVSKDAQSVAGAIKLTLAAAKLSKSHHENNTAPASQSQVAHADEVSFVDEEAIDWFSLELPAWTGYNYNPGDETAFDLMDTLLDFSTVGVANNEWSEFGA
ncbi:hypothetical protein GLAREA_02205 [Glarea lozoyensis ATCC 20868]|uniref:Xylanolytic transcriptional activator regulatory domain-containing protein n=1 Tax=Glarea lozoyensis (strain ATCC 20868 / MF5171) TaxID=1116229 RepID=S3DIC3_GLAL2|nr:uncharacterized protein GLAREA_02205 [Glarea lozoyensis ATCC 20868]EPE26293.1 hypothetical protein GLAREA_02205 [Glarea lozoyensis ATCC 20868]